MERGYAAGAVSCALRTLVPPSKSHRLLALMEGEEATSPAPAAIHLPLSEMMASHVRILRAVTGFHVC